MSENLTNLEDAVRAIARDEMSKALRDILQANPANLKLPLVGPLIANVINALPAR